MFKILDRVLARFVPTVTASAGCSVTRTCTQCPPPRDQAKLTIVTCCLNEGCTTVRKGCGSC